MLQTRLQKIFSQVLRKAATDSPSEIPRWLWYGAWGALITVVCGGLALAVLLFNGAADPPRAGPLVWQNVRFPTLNASPNYTTLAPDPIPLFRVPYTLEIAARFSANSDPAAAWGIALDQAGSANTPFEIAIIDGRFFAVSPSSPDSRPFIHIRPPGTVNRLRLDVDGAGQGTLCINDEIAWRGPVPAARSAKIYLRASRRGQATLTIERAELYAHHFNPT